MSDHSTMPAPCAFTADLGQALRVPRSVKLGPLAGRGKRSITFRATCGGEHVALKVYRRKFIDKYRRRYGLNIARYEYERNVAFHALETLRPYAAEPVGVFDDEAASSLCFLQEFVDGISLKQLAAREGGVPPETLEAARTAAGAEGRVLVTGALYLAGALRSLV